MPSRTLEILASCHALVFVDNKLVRIKFLPFDWFGVFTILFSWQFIFFYGISFFLYYLKCFWHWQLVINRFGKLPFSPSFVLTFYSCLQVGDPLEKAALKGIDWSYKSDEKAMPKK